MPKRRKAVKRRSMKKSRVKARKSRLVGYTKVSSKPTKYALVFRKGKKLAVGKSRFKTKSSLSKAAQKFL